MERQKIKTAEPPKERAENRWLRMLGAEETWKKLKNGRTLHTLGNGLPWLTAGIICAQGRLVGGAAPFAPALLGGMLMRGKKITWAAVGCLLGTLISGDRTAFLSCVLLCVMAAIFYAFRVRPNDFCCTMAIGLSMGILAQLSALTPYDRIMGAIGAFAAAALGRAFAAAMRIDLRMRRLLSGEELLSLILLALSALAGLRSAEIFGAEPVNAALFLVCMILGQAGGAGIGAASGALGGLMLIGTQPGNGNLFCALVLLGFFAGIFGKMGRVWTLAAVLPAALLTAAIQPGLLTAVHGAELAASMAGLLCLPTAAWKKLEGFLKHNVLYKEEMELPTRLSTRERLNSYAALYRRIEGRLPKNRGGAYAAISSALYALANEFKVEATDQPELKRACAEALDREGMEAEVCAVKTLDGRLEIEAQVNSRQCGGICDRNVVRVLSEAVGKTMRPCPSGICPEKGKCSLHLREAARYQVSRGWWSLSTEENICGDTLTAVELADERYLLALADGMGHDRMAQQESSEAMRLLEDFMAAGFEAEAALQAVNELLLKTCAGESFSTMDMMLVDLSSGSLKALKIGAPVSYIRRGKKLIRLSGSALPMGIVEEVQPAVTQLQLQNGDALFLFSDGVLDALEGDETALQKHLCTLETRDPDAAARELIDRVCRDGCPKDDLTVCVVRVFDRAA